MTKQINVLRLPCRRCGRVAREMLGMYCSDNCKEGDKAPAAMTVGGQRFCLLSQGQVDRLFGGLVEVGQYYRELKEVRRELSDARLQRNGVLVFAILMIAINILLHFGGS